MKLVYLTAQKYPSKKADPFYRLSMARAFAGLLGDNFSFVVRNPVPGSIAALYPVGVPAPRRLQALFYFVYLPFLVRANRWSNREVVIFSYDAYLIASAIFWRRLLRMRYRVAFDWHQLFEDWRDRYVAQGSDYCITTSARLAGLLQSRFAVAPNKIVVAYGGVDPHPFDQARATERGTLRGRLSLPAGYLVGYVGGFVAVGLPKGLDTMIAALPDLPAEVRMVFVGGLPHEIQQYQQIAEETGVADRCVFVPRQPFAQVVEHECAMDALVIPYPDLPHFREYGFPMKVWEYLCAGRPILYSNLELIGEVLKGQATPFTPGDPQDLARAVRGIYEAPEAFEAVAATNPGAVQEYTWEARAQRIIDFLA